MARRIWLHIGTMKSATTYIQELCDRNRNRLAEAGILWASADENFAATDDLLGTERLRPGLAGAWQAMDQRIGAHAGDVLISNERLARIDAAKMGRLLDALGTVEVQLIITARDLGRGIPSQWQTGVRSRLTATWTDFVAAVRTDGATEDPAARMFWRKHDVAALVSRWSRRVPVDRITIVTVPPPGSPAGLVGERFASVLGIDVSEFEQPPHINTSLGAHSAELLRRLNARTQDLSWLEYKWAFKNGLAQSVLTSRKGREPAIALTPGELTWVRDRAATMTEAITSQRVSVVGDLSDLVPVADGAVGTPEPTEGELLDAALDGLVGLGQMLADVRVEYDALVRALEKAMPAPQAGEWRAFEEDARQGRQRATSLPRKGRFLRWRLGRSGLPAA
jgi:hypothetical protein